MTDSALHQRFYVLGVPVDFSTSDAAILQAVAAVLGTERPPYLPGEADLAQAPRVRLERRETTGSALVPQFTTHPPERLTIEGPGFQGQADARAWTAECGMTAAALADRATLRDTILATLTLFLVARLDRQPFHAAALQWQEHGVLLTGLSGAGKSTLAYAAARRGWRVLTDDAVFLQSRPALRIWTRPAPLHLAPSAAGWFPELIGAAPVLRDNGKWKIEIHSVPPSQTQTLEHARVCLLQPSAGAAEIEPLSVDEAFTRLIRALEPGFAVFRDTIQPVLRALLQQDGAWLMRTGSDPRLAIRTLERALQAPDTV